MDKIEIIPRKIDGIGPWVCISTDLDATWGLIVGDWERCIKDAVLKHCTKRGTVIQAGGHQGFYPRLLSEHFKMVYTFEPHCYNFYCLYQNCYKKGNIVPFLAALGDKPDLITNLFNEQNLGMSKVVNTGQYETLAGSGAHTSDTVVIPQLSLDTMKFRDVDLMYFDVEGYEINILKGAVNTIEEHNPVIALEAPTEEVFKFMEELGYKDVGEAALDHYFIRER
jgi:FkbM family methyltransferase